LGDQHQDFPEHLSWYRDLGHLKGCVAAVAHDLGADLDQLLVEVRLSLLLEPSCDDATNDPIDQAARRFDLDGVAITSAI
jgi:hypothetical protein